MILGENMKIDIHNSIIDWLISSNLYNSLNKLVNILVERDKSIKKIQMYGDFFLPDEQNRFGKYLFYFSVRYPINGHSYSIGTCIYNCVIHISSYII